MPYFLVIASCLTTSDGLTEYSCTTEVVAQSMSMAECLDLQVGVVVQWKDQHPMRQLSMYRCVTEDQLARQLGRDQT